MVATHVWQTAISAPAYLWLAGVDEDSRMTKRTSTSVASYHALICPSYRLLVNEINGSIWSWLVASVPCLLPRHILYHTCTSMIVCSNLGPDMAISRGIWLRDHTSFLFGACITLLFSASEAYSCSGWSPTPILSTATSLVLDTFGESFEAFGFGSLTGMKFSPVFPGLCRAVEVVEAKDRVDCRETRRVTPASRARATDTGTDIVYRFPR